MPLSFLCFALTVAPLCTTSPSIQRDHERGDTLVVATYAYGAVDRRGAVTPMARVIEASLRRPVRVMIAPDPVALVDSVRTGRADIVVTNTFGYLMLADGPSPVAHAVATFRVPVGARTNYSTVLVTRHAALRGTGDLTRRAGRLRFALVSAGSTTGNLVPRLALAGYRLDDLEQQTAGVHFTGSHAAAFHALRGDAADVAGLAREEYERQLAGLPEAERAEYRVLWSSPDIMLGPVAIRCGIPAPVNDAITRVLGSLATQAPEAFVALRGGWTEAKVSDGLISASDTDYDAVRQLFGAPDAFIALLRKLSR